MGFTQCKTEQPLKSMQLQERKIHAINQNNKQTFLENKGMEPVEPVQMNIYQSNTYKKDLSWLHFDDEPKVQERQQGKDQKSCISIFVAYLTITSNNQEHQPRDDNSIHTWPLGRFIKIQSNFRQGCIQRLFGHGGFYWQSDKT